MTNTKYKRKEFNFDKWGAFFAFGDKQFNEQKEEGVDYVSLGTGLVARKDNFKQMIKALTKFSQDERERELKIRGKKNIIVYELNNHEAFYTGDIEPAMEVLEGYGFTRQEVVDVYNEIRNKQNS